MERTARSLIAGIAGVVALAACGELRELPTSPADPPPDPGATLQRVQAEVFTPTCASLGCHDTIGQQQGLVLVSGESHAMLVGVASSQVPALQRVQPGVPLDSYLYRKITGGAIIGERMPAGGPQLSNSQVLLVRDWIRRGAPDD